ncbi:FliM/FliN family flagellar motor switch protein [Novosphingobium mathurense]|uniref:Flagellar motor switch protein FliM n=1 Tax=Novosphingobium mathurense TaxID=428990 RepID=A0A1U6HHN5_9SPHN|nr:FliM/FliN family flagellar motor switch protein [Novosphingobium mathurense]SLJ95335.1 flagellar motor switch protein FliM [Novosphingobium mathurense]
MKARHCKELLGTGPSIGELVPALSLIGERLARALASGLARLSGGDAPIVRVGMPLDGTLGSIQSELEGLASHTLLAVGPEARPLLAVFEAAPVFRLVDRAFGGRGDVPNPLPDTFPLSAELLIARIETTVADALSIAFGGEAKHAVRTVRREISLRQLAPFDRNEELLLLSLEVEENGCEPWSMLLAFPQATLSALVTVPRHPRKARMMNVAPDPAAEPFASMPLQVKAVLVDMTMGFSRLSSLKPGDILPVAVARSVPLKVGDQTVANGTIGELDDRVAVQVSHAF